MNTIVVGVDESNGASAALPWALDEARARACALRVVMCWSYLEQHHGLGRATGFDPDYDEAAARLALERIVAPTVADADVPVERRVVNDLAGRGLIEASADAALLVVGARGFGGVEALVLGSVSTYCLHHAAIPVAIVPPGRDAASRGGRIVVGVDGSDHALLALRWAQAEAAIRRAALDAVHAWNLPTFVLPYVADLNDVEQAARDVLDRAVEAAGDGESDLDRRVGRHLEYGDAASVLLAAGERADLIVVGSRGLGGFKKLLLGSVSHRLVTHARCPVVVVPDAGRHGRESA